MFDVFQLNVCVQDLSVPDVCVQEVFLPDVLDIFRLCGMSLLDMFVCRRSVCNMSLFWMPESGMFVKEKSPLDMSV